MKIVLVSTYYSTGMGYAENCLPRELAKLGHEVHVVTSNLNVYGNDSEYAINYHSFLGAADQGVGVFECDGCVVHRLASRTFAGQLWLAGFVSLITQISPDIVHTITIASLQTYILAAIKPFLNFHLFTESHQHLSVMKPFLIDRQLSPVKSAHYWFTRTLPTFLTSLGVEKCYAVAPDCAYVAHRFYGVPERKVVLLPIGSDTSRFFPAVDEPELSERVALRRRLGYGFTDLVCVYTGRFSHSKNPLMLAKAIDLVSRNDPRWHALFIGDGPQSEEIQNCRNTKILPFMKHAELAKYYRAADLAVWPCQESMSMLDAIASGLPVVASDEIGDTDRIIGNGNLYRANDLTDLCSAIEFFSDSDERLKAALHGRKKVLKNNNWQVYAKTIEQDFLYAISEL